MAKKVKDVQITITVTASLIERLLAVKEDNGSYEREQIVSNWLYEQVDTAGEIVRNLEDAGVISEISQPEHESFYITMPKGVRGYNSIVAANEQAARDIVFSKIGKDWGFIYTQQEWDESDNDTEKANFLGCLND